MESQSWTRLYPTDSPSMSDGHGVGSPKLRVKPSRAFHIVDSDAISGVSPQGYLCFLNDSPIFSLLKPVVSRWKEFTTEPLFGTIQTLPASHPAYSAGSTHILLGPPPSPGRSHLWSCIHRAQFEGALQMSYEQLIGMMNDLRVNLPLLIPTHSRNWASVLGFHASINNHGPILHITPGNLNDIIIRLVQWSAAQSAPSSPDGSHPDVPTRMALELLQENFEWIPYTVRVI